MHTSTNPSLKRKRQDSEKAASKSAVVTPTKLRQVPSPAKPSTSSRAQPSPMKKPAIQHLRLVGVEKPAPPPPVDISTGPSVQALHTEVSAQDVAGPSAIDHLSQEAALQSETLTVDQQPSRDVPEPTVFVTLADKDSVAGPSTIPVDDIVPKPSSQVTDEEPETYGLRRTTRARKPVNGVIPTSTHRNVDTQAQPRRRKTPAPQGTGPFSGMTVGDLRQLTSTNTTRNQKYMAALLETEIIR